MDFGTTATIIEQDVEEGPSVVRDRRILPREAVSEPPSNSGTTVTAAGVERSSTSTLPASIWENWEELVRTNVSKRLYADLVRLASGPSARVGIETSPLRADSLRTFLEFWSLIRDEAAEPEVALAPDGTIHAEWFESPRKRLDVRFTSPHVFFGLFANNNILEGVDRLKTVAQLLKLHPTKPLSRSAR